LMIGLVQWLPMIVFAEVLRRTQSFSFVIVVSMVMGSFAVILQFLLWPDLDQFWRSMLEQMFSQAEQSSQYESLLPIMEQMIHWMVLMFMAAMVSTYIATLMIARWFQAKLVESDGYKKEFYEIKLGTSNALIGSVIIAASLVAQLDWLIAVAIVVGTGFLFQGLAVVHARINQSKKKGLLNGIFYFLMFVFPHVVALTTVVGIVDNWTNFRKGIEQPETY